MAGWITVGLAGWLWGSFLNQCVDRLADRSAFSTTGSFKVSLFRPARSICLHCGVPIPWYDNIPILSCLLLRGSCRSCGHLIGRRTLVLEIATPLIGLGIYAAWGFALTSVAAWLTASWTLVAVPLRLEGTSWPVGWWWLGIASWTFFFWSAALG